PAPRDRNPLARPFLERRAISRNRLLKTLRPALPPPERRKRSAEIVLRHPRIVLDPRAIPFLPRRSERCNRLLKTTPTALPLPKRPKRSAEIIVGYAPFVIG